jgi:4-hydroxyproline epimerase
MPELGEGSVAERAHVFRDKHDHFRAAVVNEPRGSEVLVGALRVEASDASCLEGVIFFNNVGTLGMCGHGLIGLIKSLEHLGRIGPGTHRIETPVGIVTAALGDDGSVSVENVPSHRTHKGVTIDVPDRGMMAGDVAWGGNWFFLVEDHGLDLTLTNLDELTRLTRAVRRAVNAQGFPEIDHIELFGPPRGPGAHSRNFVLCPGGAYDRSPCGTGTSAKLACLAADGKLGENEVWVQESIIGSTFRGSFVWADQPAGIVVPTITGTAHITAEATLLFDERDPLCWGIR